MKQIDSSWLLHSACVRGFSTNENIISQIRVAAGQLIMVWWWSRNTAVGLAAPTTLPPVCVPAAKELLLGVQPELHGSAHWELLNACDTGVAGDRWPRKSVRLIRFGDFSHLHNIPG